MSSGQPSYPPLPRSPSPTPSKTSLSHFPSPPETSPQTPIPPPRHTNKEEQTRPFELMASTDMEDDDEEELPLDPEHEAAELMSMLSGSRSEEVNGEHREEEGGAAKVEEEGTTVDRKPSILSVKGFASYDLLAQDSPPVTPSTEASFHPPRPSTAQPKRIMSPIPSPAIMPHSATSSFPRRQPPTSQMEQQQQQQGAFRPSSPSGSTASSHEGQNFHQHQHLHPGHPLNNPGFTSSRKHLSLIPAHPQQPSSPSPSMPSTPLHPVTGSPFEISPLISPHAVSSAVAPIYTPQSGNSHRRLSVASAGSTATSSSSKRYFQNQSGLFPTVAVPTSVPLQNDTQGFQRGASPGGYYSPTVPTTMAVSSPHLTTTTMARVTPVPPPRTSLIDHAATPRTRSHPPPPLAPPPHGLIRPDPSSFSASAPSSPATAAARGVRLVEVIASDATVLRRNPDSPRSAVAFHSHTPSAAKSDDVQSRTEGCLSTGTLRRLGTTRTMSMRGKRPTPRIVKKRIVNKTDAKSYFSAERTMYSWINIGTVILGFALTLYAFAIIPDPKVRRIATLAGTLLSALSLIVILYAAISFHIRRKALARRQEATSFDDRWGPVVIVGLIVIGLLLYELLVWMNPLSGFKVNLGKKAFGVTDMAGTYTFPNGTVHVIEGGGGKHKQRSDE